MAKDSDINRRIDRVEEIIDKLDADDISLEDGRDFYDEGQVLLSEIRERLDNGEGEVIEIE